MATDVLRGMREQQAQRQAADVAAAMASTPNGAPPPPTAQPFPSNDEWLASPIASWRRTPPRRAVSHESS
jgi:hypothetical protein